MNRQFVVALAAVVSGLGVSAVFGQCGCGVPTYAPLPPNYSTYYAPSDAPTVTHYAPTPQVAYYTPASQVTYYAPAPQVAYYAPTPHVTYYTPTPQVAYYAPAAQVSYYAPIAQRVYYSPARPAYATHYAPVVSSAVVGSSIYGTPKVYVAGQPVRNTLRAVTP